MSTKKSKRNIVNILVLDQVGGGNTQQLRKLLDDGYESLGSVFESNDSLSNQIFIKYKDKEFPLGKI